ncbi:hypothetical protein [Jatrophihabitans lederbergiae]|uniref:DUF222 domain-containing protein n=1 Tax=Jatrophihabitans lederbergiae TaxID=3075547 RepID=A0ABU2JC19_9ACTN|nr:hypothetical protein [Jatrophihabitans sp. DSM 44399]MDT0262296.1 hypothetical protein [Jatrophihabitans sp. DSM 44399]
MSANDTVTISMTETVTYEITLTHARLAEILDVPAADVPALLADIDNWAPTGPIEDHNELLDEIDCDTYRAGSEDRTWAVRAARNTAPVITDPSDITDDLRSAAADRCEQRARALIAQGVAEDTALAQAADEAVLFTRDLTQLARLRSHTLAELTRAYDGNVYRLLRDLGDHLDLSLAYIDRATINAHVERSLTDAEWQAIHGHFTAMDFDDHVGEQGTFRTEWIESVLDKAGVPGYGFTTEGHPTTNAQSSAA